MQADLCIRSASEAELPTIIITQHTSGMLSINSQILVPTEGLRLNSLPENALVSVAVVKQLIQEGFGEAPQGKIEPNPDVLGDKYVIG